MAWERERNLWQALLDSGFRRKNEVGRVRYFRVGRFRYFRVERVRYFHGNDWQGSKIWQLIHAPINQ